MKSHTKTMSYYDKIDSLKSELSGRELFNSLLILINEVISDTELNQQDTKDLLIAVTEVM